METQIIYSRSAKKAIEKYDKTTKHRIRAAIEGLLEVPTKGDIKLLQGFSDGRKRLRVGKYRIIYQFREDGTICVLYVMNIDSRGDIYK